MERFNEEEIKSLFTPSGDSKNGQVTIVGGSELFHGAPVLSLKVASRVVDMVFFATPEKSVGHVAESLKSRLSSFIWVPWDETDDYVAKSDACLIGPGFMRYRKEKDTSKYRETNADFDEAGSQTKDITERLLTKFADKKWVIDAGSLQVMEVEWIPAGSILTPNQKEYKRLFGEMDVSKASEKHNCTILLKGQKDVVSSKGEACLVEGGNAGMAKGGTGDVLAGLVTSFFAKNDPFLSAKVASFVTKKAAEDLEKKVGFSFNADDLADKIPQTFKNLKS